MQTRTCLLYCCLASLLAPLLNADTLTSFTIQNATNYTQSGGTFDGGQGSYSGTFTIDETTYASGSGDPISSYDIFVTPPGSSASEELKSSAANSGNSQFSLTNCNTFVFADTEDTMCVAGLTFGNPGDGESFLYLGVTEPTTQFVGGTVYDAAFVVGPDYTTVYEDHQLDAIIIDPAAVPPAAPEPATWLLIVSALPLLLCVRYAMSKRLRFRSIMSNNCS